jgi:ATP-binding cassette, subfamily F, member 3
MLIKVDRVKKSFGTTDVFYDCSLLIKENEKIAIVGPNGSGKTTLLKMITKEEGLDDGNIIVSNQVKIGYLRQMAFEDESKTVGEHFEEVFEKLNHLKKEIRVCEQELVINPTNQKILDRYARLTNDFENLGGYYIQSQMETVLSKMGFEKKDKKRIIKDFSGGQKTRLALAKLLLSFPDILVLDEPTNHLDLEMIEWLESFLYAYPRAVIFVSHDRKFIDKVAQSILAIENKKITRYPGNYSAYVTQRNAQIEKQEKAYAQQQKDIVRLETLIEKFRYKKNKAAFAQSKIKYLDRMEKIEKPSSDHRSFNVLFQPRLRGAKEVCILDQVKIGYDKALATISCSIFRNQKIAIVGRNGVGKSTLLRSIAGTLPILSGEMVFGHQIEVGYFDQQLAQLNSNKTVLEEVWDEFENLDKTEIRKVLGQFLFTQDDVFKQVSDCSGGEKVRLTLAKLMLMKANFLVLDEPTNHLDIQAKEALELSLKEYQGTLLFVSHDRYFIDAIADTVWYFDENQLIIQDLKEPVLTTQQQEDVIKKERKEQQIKKRQEKKEVEKHVKRVEKEITLAEDELEQLREKRYDPDYYHDYEKLNELNYEIDEQHNRINRLLKEWESLTEMLNEEEENENI